MLSLHSERGTDLATLHWCRQFQRSVQAALCHERLKSKAAAAAACRKPSARVQQTHLRDPTPIRDSLRKQVHIESLVHSDLSPHSRSLPMLSDHRLTSA